MPVTGKSKNWVMSAHGRGGAVSAVDRDGFGASTSRRIRAAVSAGRRSTIRTRPSTPVTRTCARPARRPAQAPAAVAQLDASRAVLDAVRQRHDLADVALADALRRLALSRSAAASGARARSTEPNADNANSDEPGHGCWGTGSRCRHLSARPGRRSTSAARGRAKSVTQSLSVPGPSRRSLLYWTFMTLSSSPGPRLHQVLVHVEVERQHRVIREHDAARPPRAAPRRRAGSGLRDRVGEQRVVARVRVPGQVDAEVRSAAAAGSVYASLKSPTQLERNTCVSLRAWMLCSSARNSSA